MIKYLFTCFFACSCLFPYNNNRFLLDEIFEEIGWTQVEKHSDSLIVSKKQIFDIPIPAYKATMLTSAPLDYVMSAVLDADGQQEFMASSHVVESTLLDFMINDTTFLYQMLDLPIVSDRHYITKNYTDTLSSSHYRLNWEINSSQNMQHFKSLIDSKSSEYSNPIFVDDGVGSWEIKKAEMGKIFVSYYILINPGGWIPNYLISYVNKRLVPETVIAMVNEGKRRAPSTNDSYYLLFCIDQSLSPLDIVFNKDSDFDIANNLEVDIFLKANNIDFIERWSPNAEDGDCSNGVCLNRIYRIKVPYTGARGISRLIDSISSLESVLYAEEDAARNILNRKRTN